MEARTILVANTKTQKRYTFESSATTLGELKAEMAAHDIDYTGMDFTEGITQTKFINDSSVLPTNVMYKGAPTNNLIMLLSNTQKNIASGVMSRKEAYDIIKEDKELQEFIKDHSYRNYTQVATSVLEGLINVYQKDTDTPKCEKQPEAPKKEVTAAHPALVAFIYDGIKLLADSYQLVTNDVTVLSDLITELAARMKESQVTISDKDIDDMIANL